MQTDAATRNIVGQIHKAFEHCMSGMESSLLVVARQAKMLTVDYTKIKKTIDLNQSKEQERKKERRTEKSARST